MQVGCPAPKRAPRNGFTLIELMVVVAIVGLLASLAIPEYRDMMLRAKRAELTMLNDAIRVSEWGYYAEWNEFTSCALMPADVPGRVAVDFPATLASGADWVLLGWLPDGKVYGQYEVTASGAFTTAHFTVQATSDIDGDGNLARAVSTHIEKPHLATPNNVY